MYKALLSFFCDAGKVNMYQRIRDGKYIITEKYFNSSDWYTISEYNHHTIAYWAWSDLVCKLNPAASKTREPVLLKKCEIYDWKSEIVPAVRLYELPNTHFQVTATVPTRRGIQNVSFKKHTYDEALQAFQRIENFIWRDKGTTR